MTTYNDEGKSIQLFNKRQITTDATKSNNKIQVNIHLHYKIFRAKLSNIRVRMLPVGVAVSESSQSQLSYLTEGREGVKLPCTQRYIDHITYTYLLTYLSTKSNIL